VTDDQQWHRRIEVLEAKDQIATVMAEYLFQVDRPRDRDVLNQLFAANAVWEALGNLSEMGVTTSREAIVEMLVALPDTLSFTAHFIGNPVIEVSDDVMTGRGRWHTLELMSKGGDEPAEIVCVAWYDNEFVHEGGKWRLSHIRYEDSLVFPFTEGWRDTRYVSLLTGERVAPSATS
jgi:SnoaL-like domain